MRTTTLLVVAAAAVANAGYTNGNGTYVCGRPNANYCLGDDIILRCDAYGHGTPGRCSDNLSGYPPAGGVGSCYEKSGSYGDAACEKNCVVYADPPYTLPPALCQPSYSSTSSTPESTTNVYTEHVPVTTKPVYYNSTVPGEPSYTGEPAPPVSYTTKCATYTYPNPTKSGESITRTITYTVPAYPPHSSNATATYNPPTNPPHTTFVPVTSEPAHNNGSCASCTGGNGGYGNGGNGGYGNGGNGGQNGGESATRLPVGPASTSASGPETIPTGGAAANAVSGVLAVVGIAAAFLV